MAEPSLYDQIHAVCAVLPAPPAPIPEAADPALRDSLADHLEFELKRRTLPPIWPGGSGLSLTTRDIANLAIAYLEAHRG